MAKDPATARAEALTFLKSQSAGVLATVASDGKPHASAVFYVADDNFNLYFLTKLHSRKYEAMQAQPSVAFTIGRLDVPQTLQIEGMAVELRDDQEKGAHVPDLIETLEKNNPHYIPVAKMDSDMVIMWIQPKWVRWGDFSAPGIGNEAVFTEIPVGQN